MTEHSSEQERYRLIRVNNIAVELCNADDTYDHHDQTDDHPCTRCLRYAKTVERIVVERLRRVFEDLRGQTDEIEGVPIKRPDGLPLWIHTADAIDEWLRARLTYEIRHGGTDG